MSSVWASLGGAVFLEQLAERLRTYQDWMPVIYGGIMVLIMMFLPRGLFVSIAGGAGHLVRRLRQFRRIPPQAGRETTSMPLLETRKLRKEFGGLVALKDFDLQVKEGQIKAVIGPNGAGKTTFFNLVAGSLKPSSGEVALAGHSITGAPPHRIARRGIARTFQTLRLFHEMTAVENVMVGCHGRYFGGMTGATARVRAVRWEDRRMREDALEALEFVGVRDSGNRHVSALPFADQRRVEIARALAAHPKLILLDEPAAGLNMRETEEMADLITRIRESGVTVLLVEHDMSLVMGISDEIAVLDHGEKIAEGPPETVRKDERVIGVYLGAEV
jgi:branched-chain amino acid transport system ATP-binding protein